MMKNTKIFKLGDKVRIIKMAKKYCFFNGGTFNNVPKGTVAIICDKRGDVYDVSFPNENYKRLNGWSLISSEIEICFDKKMNQDQLRK